MAMSAPLTEYEKLRLENMKRNQVMIDALRIDSAKSEMHHLYAGPYANRRAGQWRKEDLVALRRSRRSTRVNPTAEHRQGIGSSTSCMKPVQPTLAVEHTKQSLPLATVCIRGSSNTDLLSQLQDIDENAPLSSLPCMKKFSEGAAIEPSRFSLQKRDIARVVPERITSASFLPTSEHLFLAAGDKLGHLGFWDVESNDPEGDGLHIYRPHLMPLSGIAFPAFHATKVLTCSYDQTVKLLDVQTATFKVMYCSDKEEIVSAICSVPGNPSCVFIAEGPGCLKMLDMRENRHSLNAEAHRMTINTIDVNLHSPWLVVTSSTDLKVKVWDVRKLDNTYRSLCSLSHQKAVHSAQFSPSGKAIVTCSYDNTVALANTSCKQQRFIAHANMHLRGVSSIRAIWGWDDRFVFVGNIKRSIDIISAKFEIECEWLTSPLMKSIPSRLAVHPYRPGLLAGCSSSGEVYLWSQ
ncbi:hypothetical protein GOP47_0008318 [Adiantum capillus-veneris]|uniref:WD repeat-containing protein 76 n=1 Tax=Adiantum capillus-veneris TaxID=13818 RepID=A0A9D4ZHY0_ADICA|nr:hypothetical protein GOP47_0008318 [Adiantum capillus-veneris]